MSSTPLGVEFANGMVMRPSLASRPRSRTGGSPKYCGSCRRYGPMLPPVQVLMMVVSGGHTSFGNRWPLFEAIAARCFARSGCFFTLSVSAGAYLRRKVEVGAKRAVREVADEVFFFAVERAGQFAPACSGWRP